MRLTSRKKTILSYFRVKPTSKPLAALLALITRRFQCQIRIAAQRETFQPGSPASEPAGEYPTKLALL